MEAKSFISHTEKGGTDVGIIIQDQLIMPPLEMKCFLSKNTIENGEHIPQKILEFLIKTDVLFLVVESRVISSRWVRWEYEFCKKRGIRPIPIVFQRFIPKINQIDWLDSNDKFVMYTGNQGDLRNEVWNDIDDSKIDLEDTAKERNSIELEANSENQSYFEQEIVKVSGTVKNSLIGTAFLHIPYLKDEYPPIQTKEITTSIIPDDDGNFNFDFPLPVSPVPTQIIQKWFIEIKFDKKSILIPISICIENKGKEISGDDTAVSPPSELPTGEDGIKEKIAFVSRGTFDSIPKTINEKTISRDDKISDLLSLLEENDRIVVTGDKGAGKSSLMCQAYEKISEKYTTLFLRCDDYLGIKNYDELNEFIIPEHDFLKSINKISTETEKLVVIFDSLDAISRNEKSMNIFKYFLKMIWGTRRVKTICSVRSYDYEYSPSITQTDWGKRYNLELLTKEERDHTLSELNNPQISDELKNILNNPLHLKLLSLILQRSPDADFTKIKDEIELYDEYWNEYVEKLENAEQIRNTLYGIAQEMSTKQRVSILYENLETQNYLQEILSRNIVFRETSTNQIRFFHHAFLDYVLSKYILSKHEEFVDYIAKDEYNVFLRPTIIFALSMLSKRDSLQFVKTLEKILHSDLKYFWKISSLTSLARIEKFDSESLSSIGDFLSENIVLQRHFLIEIQKQMNSFWFDLWKNSFFVKWASHNNPNSWFIVNYIKSIIPMEKDHVSIFKILQLLVSNSTHNWTKRTAIQISSEITVENKVEWLTELSTNFDSDIRNGVVETLPNLIESNPETVPEIFKNLFTYVERSDEKTQSVSYGTMGMTSTKKQDNHMVIWRAGELFPKLLSKNPEQMIISAIKVFEVLRKRELDEYEGGVIEDHGYVWFEGVSFSDLRDENKLLNHIITYLQNFDATEITKLIPIFNSTKLATFRSILIDALVLNKEIFINEIFEQISNPVVYEITTLKRSIRSAIQNIISMLKEEKILKILECIMNIKLTERELDDEDIKILKRLQAEFLSEIPHELLKEEHIKILDIHSKSELKYSPSCEFKTEIGVPSDEVIYPKKNPEEIIAEKIGKELEYREKIDLLESISKYFAKKTSEVDAEKFEAIKIFLIANIDDEDPKDNAEFEDSSVITYYGTIRGLVARCLIQLLYHSKDPSLVENIVKLSNDPINKVRGEISRALNYLFFYDYDLTYSITKRYSEDPDVLVQFFLLEVLRSIINKNSKHGIIIIRNLFSTEPKNYRKIQGIENFLLYLALYKKEEDAKNLLNQIIDERLFTPEIRCNFPFTLKENYLFKDEFQDESLDILYRLLDDPDNEVREKAAFFTLNSFEKDESVENIKFVEKIIKHLDRISSEVERRPWDPRLIEELVRFLDKFWNIIPEKTVDYLEKITDEKIEGYSAYQPVFADESVKILTGLFQYPLLSKDDRKRCLNILDKYAMAGWDRALELLSSMERPD